VRNLRHFNVLRQNSSWFFVLAPAIL